MRESIKLDLATPDGDDLMLEIEYDDFDDTLGLFLGSEDVMKHEVGGGDWTRNIRPALERALELWPAVELEPGEGR